MLIITGNKKNLNLNNRDKEHLKLYYERGYKDEKSTI